MISFGVSAFLKVASLNPKPRITELRKRIHPLEASDPYDFHRRLKLAAKKHFVEGLPFDELLETAEGIRQLPERKATLEGLRQLSRWLDSYPGLKTPYRPPSRVYESPRSVFKISFQPEFGLIGHGKNAAYQIWNTQKPELKLGAIYSTLALMADEFTELDDCPPDFGILSLREPKTYYHSDPIAGRYAAAESMVEWIEEIILDLQADDGPHDSVHDRHPAPWG